MMRYGYGMMGSWGGSMLGGLIMIVVFALIVFAVVYIVSKNNRTNVVQTTSIPAKGTPITILQERFARGEIAKEEYLEMKRTLEEN